MGMKSMQEDALEKIAQGITSVEEVMRVVPMETRGQAQCVGCGRGIMRNLNFCPHCGSRQEIEMRPGIPAAHSEVEVTRP
jgi:rRNA maturation endonuclease Nob1